MNNNNYFEEREAFEIFLTLIQTTKPGKYGPGIFANCAKDAITIARIWRQSLSDTYSEMLNGEDDRTYEPPDKDGDEYPLESCPQEVFDR